MGGADQREAATLRIGDVAPCGWLASGPFGCRLGQARESRAPKDAACWLPLAQNPMPGALLAKPEPTCCPGSCAATGTLPDENAEAVGESADPSAAT